MHPKPKISKSITYFGQPAVLACDGDCSKAWGINSRPRDVEDPNLDPSDENDWVWFADGELPIAPVDPGTYEGFEGKPTPDMKLQSKWCARECERSRLTRPGEDNALPDFSKRVYNIGNRPRSQSQTMTTDGVDKTNPTYYDGDACMRQIAKVTARMRGASAFCIGQAIKYMWRAGKKTGEAMQDDAGKATWYLEWHRTRQTWMTEHTERVSDDLFAILDEVDPVMWQQRIIELPLPPDADAPAAAPRRASLLHRARDVARSVKLAAEAFANGALMGLADRMLTYEIARMQTKATEQSDEPRARPDDPAKDPHAWPPKIYLASEISVIASQVRSRVDIHGYGTSISIWFPQGVYEAIREL